ncbi:MAG: hypothetical protein LBN23_00910, partial [Paludibacter sp.]|nr:hypothetical protein [Paludibacter sp.]
QRDKTQWSVIKYDALGRVVYTGVINRNITTAEKNTIKNMAVIEERITGASSSSIMGYTCNVFSNEITVLTVSYYDDYSFLNIAGFPKHSHDPSNVYNMQYDTSMPEYNTRYGDNNNFIAAKGLLTGEIDAIPDYPGYYNYSTYYYDYRGQQIQNIHKTWKIKMGDAVPEEYQLLRIEYVKYNFSGQPLKRYWTQYYDGWGSIDERYTYTYDHAGRATEVKYRGYNAEFVLAKNTYDELGRLTAKKTNNNANLNVAYSYNLRGWLTGISNPLFSQSLQYGYNGNILQATYTQGSGSKTYSYAYDYYNRLTSLSSTSGEYNYYGYNKHGSIESIYRSLSSGDLDDAYFTYKGNQVKNYVDYASNYTHPYDLKDYAGQEIEYIFNANGALTKDLNKGISDIKYNLLNLPTQIDIKSPVAEARETYVYSAKGERLNYNRRWNYNYSTNPVIGTAVNVSAMTATDEVIYAGNQEYDRSNDPIRINFDGGYFNYSNFTDYVFISDHQGNVRVVADKNGNAVQCTDYDPFGMTAVGSTNQTLQDKKYNGKELVHQDGLNWYNYGARWYDPARGQFTSIDPLAEKYYSVSPYAYCLNNPVKYVDPDGRDVWEIDGNGNIVQHITDKTQDAFYMVAKDNNGKYQRTYTTDEDGNKTYNSVSFEYGTVTDAKKAGWFRDATSFSITSEAAGADLFKFFADNTKIEFGLINTQDNGSLVMTNHKENSVRASATAQKLSDKGQTVTSILHNHPDNSQPSGFRTGDTSGDKFAADKYLPNVDRYVYHPRNGSLIQYDNNRILGTTSWGVVFPSSAKLIPVVPVRHSGVGLPPP